MVIGKMMTKQDILDAIRETAKENGGKPLGQNKFAKETGIKPHHWGKYWARLGDAQKEAGLLPNQLTVPYEDEFLIEKIIGLARKLGKFPTYREMQVHRSNDSELPDQEAFYRFGNKDRFVTKVIEYCKEKSGYDDIVALCEPILKKPNKSEKVDDPNSKVGEVYIFKSGRYYKIGKTNDTVRRGSELRIQLPEELHLIHSIKTDDPSGIEAYWHKRFEAKRMEGEWFNLSVADVKAFKRWRRIY